MIHLFQNWRERLRQSNAGSKDRRSEKTSGSRK